MSDEIAGFPSKLGRDPFTGRTGAFDIVPAPARDGAANTTSRSNRVQDGRVPVSKPRSVGRPDPVNPLGRGWNNSQV